MLSQLASSFLSKGQSSSITTQDKSSVYLYARKSLPIECGKQLVHNVNPALVCCTPLLCTYGVRPATSSEVKFLSYRERKASVNEYEMSVKFSEVSEF